MDTLTPPSSDSGEACENCDKTQFTKFFCADCGLGYCEDCWSNTKVHAPGRTNSNGVPHEKLNREVADLLRHIFTPPSDPAEQRKLHETDADTIWFGVVRNVTDLPVLQDYGRYAKIMQESSTGEYAERWPQLVSFVGQTGAGKSTLVKTLVEYQRNVRMRNSDGFPTPVAGSINDHAPTSGDVHLYADPSTYTSQHPVLYADCEGMDGGERIPIGATSKDNTRRQQLPKKIRKFPKSVKREMVWANNPEKCKREFAVKNLYPRLLYAFSDIVVFVLRNGRTFESAALVPMLQWAAASIEGSVNQSAMPHAIIVLNFTDPSTDPSGWSTSSATDSLFNTYSNAVWDNDDVRIHAKYWQERGTPVNNTKDLLLCYYSTIDVVRMPQKGRYALVDQQVQELNAQIQSKCTDARENRKRLRVTFNSEEFQAALSMGFDHFSKRLDAPFDFVELSWNLNPIPKDFGGNILRLALAIKNDPLMKNATGPEIFKHLGHMVASCIMLDFVRHKLKGTASRLIYHYEECYTRALKEFCEDWWPCSFENARGRCVNTQRGHAKGHQDDRGRILASGDYQTLEAFNERNYAPLWHTAIGEYLDSTRERMERMRRVQLQILREIERHLGGIPITKFFDLIVGTSTGGIIALGLGVENWTLTQCTKHFEDLIFRAFAARDFNGVPILEAISTFKHKGKYKTRPFVEGLTDVFTNAQLFGGTSDNDRYRRKVAVVSTTEAGQKAVILTNYNRPSQDVDSNPQKAEYHFERPEKGDAELKLFEVCRATTAATGYFKPFCNDRTGVNYIDGGLYYQNPIQIANEERKLLWPDVQAQPPDIILSIGTTREEESKISRGGKLSKIKSKMFKTALNRFDNTADAETTWDQFLQEVRLPNSFVNHRYIRLNPKVKKQFQFDDVEEYWTLIRNNNVAIKSKNWTSTLRNVAHRLIASSFYFEKDTNDTDENTVQGYILCRFPDESPELRRLARQFQDLQTHYFSPHFRVSEHHQDRGGATIEIPADTIAAMLGDLTFSMEMVQIPLSSKVARTTISLRLSKDDEALPISGFPRHLMTEGRNFASQTPSQGKGKSASRPVKKDFAATGDEADLTDTSSEHMPSWARGRQSPESASIAELADTSVDMFPTTATVTLSPQAETAGFLSGLFKSKNHSYSSIQTNSSGTGTQRISGSSMRLKQSSRSADIDRQDDEAWAAAQRIPDSLLISDPAPRPGKGTPSRRRDPEFLHARSSSAPDEQISQSLRADTPLPSHFSPKETQRPWSGDNNYNGVAGRLSTGSSRTPEAPARKARPKPPVPYKKSSLTKSPPISPLSPDRASSHNTFPISSNSSSTIEPPIRPSPPRLSLATRTHPEIPPHPGRQPRHTADSWLGLEAESRRERERVHYVASTLPTGSPSSSRSNYPTTAYMPDMSEEEALELALAESMVTY
ncbi:hypothetical protein G7Y89_g7253 [Cudoniella acicularis]|uniref:PNPLA domain-containing protein n=1 Tax=Cudoniella acicularis TaxID=354080 RepID=A0A8H4W1Q3_9HELO|nr:hypothetical protein G7Y89_g7253 [Cudoniella acicularis]